MSSLKGLKSAIKSATANIDITGKRDASTNYFKGSLRILNFNYENSTKAGNWNIGYHNEYRQKLEKMVDDHKS
ncbi:hypothetical protein BLOT_009648 [Blomia tropicalis]|nr:hypothetical protein BLOT_009648 [Blomia tropicalis]